MKLNLKLNNSPQQEIEDLKAEVAHLRAFFIADETVSLWCNLCGRVHALDVPHKPRKETNQ